MMKRSVLLAALALAACGHPDPAARFAEARSAFAAEDYARARTAVLAGLEADHANRAMLLLLVRANLALRDGDGAGRALGRLAETGAARRDLVELEAEAALLRGQGQVMADLLRDDASATAWRLRGEAALADGESAAALIAFRKGMAAGYDDRLAADLARMLIDADDLDGAAAVMRPGGRLDNLMIAGLVAERRGQAEAARQAYATAAARFPARPEPVVALADLADMAGDRDQTARLARQAAALGPGDPQVFSLRVRVAAEQGDWAAVRTMLAPREGSLDLHSFEGLAYGEALLNLGHGEQARAIYQKALLLSPQNPYARLMLARCDLAVGDGAGALATIRPLADSVMAGQRELDLAVQAAAMAHSPDQAGYAARLHSPRLAAITADVGRALAATGRRDWAGALAAWQALPGSDRDPEVMKQMAQAASRLGHADQALGYADRALALDSRNPDMLHMAGLVRLDAGRDSATARTLLRQALERDPDNRLFRADLARAGG
jgi:tetratricopeptide (TPR) repeat protein